MTRRTRARGLVTIMAWTAVTVLSAAPASAQASLSEGFESAGTVPSGQHGPGGLIASGWEFRNQSEPASSGDWRRSAWAYQGSWSLIVDSTVGLWQDDKSEIASWAILPAVPGQAAGDEVRFFFTCGSAPPLVPTARLEVRYSPSGGTGTGSKPADVGDFSVLLADVPDLEQPWSELRATVPGGGRLAFRFRVPPAPAQSSFWGDFSIDNLSVGAPFVAPLLPGPGETVTWTLAMSPIEITEIATIPTTGTVLVDPGVVVNLSANLTVAGSLAASGAPGQPVSVNGPGRLLVPGALRLDEVLVDALVQPEDGGELVCTRTTFLSNGPLTTVASPTYVWSDPAYVKVEDCAFVNSNLRVGACTVELRDTSFDGSYCDVGGYVLLDGVTIDGSPYQGLYLLGFTQPLYLDRVAITNSAGAGIDLGAANVQLGPDVTLAGNLYPVELGGGGFLPGSFLPATGNVVNRVQVVNKWTAPPGDVIWSDVGIPYAVHDAYRPGHMQVLPGVNIRLAPAASMWGDTMQVYLRGLPDDPVVVERLDPAQSWQGLQYLRRLENCVIDGGDIGARFHSIGTPPGYIDNCVIRNCTFGTQNYAIVRKTLFENNGTGSWNDGWTDALDGAVGANGFEGNTVAVDSAGRLVDAPNNWWGDPSGPTSSSNPGGQGQTVLGAGVTTAPFLTAPPDFADSPPVVRLNHHSTLLEANEKVILTWRAQDDGAIVSQRIEFHHPQNGVQVVADDLPGSARAFEWTVPDVGFIVSCGTPEIRVIAVDDAGQEGWDFSEHLIPSGEVQGTLNIETPLAGPFVAGADAGQLCWTPVGTNPLGFTVSAGIQLGADRASEGLGGVTSYLTCLSGEMQMPFVSTDTARVAIAIQDGGCNRVKYVFSNPFEIRPDPRFGDAPPSVRMLSPQAGEAYPGGETIPIRWTASDDEGLRAFHVQASYDGGRTWHYVREDLAASARRARFRLPASTGIPDVRMRVIAVDLRFQNSSDGAQHAFSIRPGSGGAGPDARRTREVPSSTATPLAR